MTATAFVDANILGDGQWIADRALVVRDGVIEAAVAADAIPSDAQIVVCEGLRLLPGFVDTQVNGGGGVLFNDVPTVDGIAAIADAHRRFGTTALFPTLISDDLSVIARAIAAVDAAIAKQVPGIVGIHIEGPFLNIGKRGIHDAAKFRTLDADAIDLLTSLKNGRTLVTLAPELAPPGAIRALVERGIVVAAGHTLATCAQMRLAIDEGMTGVTHLFNAMTQMEGRAPGVVGAALDSDLVCGIIVDGHHVDPTALRAAYRAKGAGQLMLVTDAMPIVGTDAAGFRLGDLDIIVADGALRSADGTLAGSSLDMASAVRNAVAMMGVDPAAASRMASATPAGFMGLHGTRGRIAAGYRADFVLLDEALEVRRVFIAGALV